MTILGVIWHPSLDFNGLLVLFIRFPTLAESRIPIQNGPVAIMKSPGQNLVIPMS